MKIRAAELYTATRKEKDGDGYEEFEGVEIREWTLLRYLRYRFLAYLAWKIDVHYWDHRTTERYSTLLKTFRQPMVDQAKRPTARTREGDLPS